MVGDNIYYEGPYLNPRDTFGWTEELVQYLESVKTAPAGLKEYLNNLEANLTDKELSKIKDTPKGRQALYDDLSAVGIKCLGIGKDTKHAVGDATKRLNAIYKRLAPGQYKNFAALKWSYLDPEYLIEDQVIVHDHKILCIIEQLG
jgi:hypothetical protein